MRVFIIMLSLFSASIFATPVNINTADAKTISKSLAGIGQKKSEEIIRYRTKNGNFTSLSELINVKGIGQKTIDKNAKDILFSSSKQNKKTNKKASKKQKEEK